MAGCQRCGHDNDSSARFCVYCGAPMAGPATPVGAGPSGRLPSGGYSTRPSTPGSPPSLIVPGASGISERSEAAHSPVPGVKHPTRGQGLAFAATAPPLVDVDLDRAIPDRGQRRSRSDAGDDPSSPRVTHNPAMPYASPPGRALPPLVDPRGVVETRSAVDPLSVSADAVRVLAGFLVSYEADALGQSWPIHQGRNHVGRVGGAVGADIELPHATVSSRHAIIYASAQPGRLVLRDQGSTNGSFVNDSVLQPEEPRELRDGDRVRLGLFTLIVKII